MAGSGFRWNIGEPCCPSLTPQWVTTRKYDASGGLLWRKDDGNAVYGVRLDNFGDLDVSATANAAGSLGNLRQYSPAGIQQWEQTNIAKAGGMIAVDSADNIVVGGTSALGAVGQVGFGNSNFPYVLEYSDTGVVILDNGLPLARAGTFTDVNSLGDRIVTPATTHSGSVMVFDLSRNLKRAYVQAGVPFALDAADNIYCTNVGSGSRKSVQKLNSRGEIQWTWTPTYDSGMTHIVVDPSGDIFLAVSKAGGTYSLVKLNSSGVFQWDISAGTMSVGDLMLDGSGGIYVAGRMPDNPAAIGVAVPLIRVNASGATLWYWSNPDSVFWPYSGVYGNALARSGSTITLAVVVSRNSPAYGTLFQVSDAGVTLTAPTYPYGGASLVQFPVDQWCSDLAVDSGGNVYAAMAGKVTKWNSTVTTALWTVTFAGGIWNECVYVDPADQVWVYPGMTGSGGPIGGVAQIRLYNTSGSQTGTIDRAQPFQDSVPAGHRGYMVCDSTGRLMLSGSAQRTPGYLVRDASGANLYQSGFTRTNANYHTGSLVVSGTSVYLSGGWEGAATACLRKFSDDEWAWDGPTGPLGFAVAVDSSGNTYVGGSRVGAITVSLGGSGASVLSGDSTGGTTIDGTLQASLITGGTFKLVATCASNNTVGITAAIAWNASAADVGSAIDAVVGSGLSLCTGGPLPASPVTITNTAVQIRLVDSGSLIPGPHTTLKINSSGGAVWRVDHGAAVNAVAVDGIGNVYTGGAVANAGSMLFGPINPNFQNACYLMAAGTITGGTFVLSDVGGVITVPIAWNASASDVQSALIAAGAGAVTCTGGPLPGTPIKITGRTWNTPTIVTTGLVIDSHTTRKYDSAGTLLWSVNHKAPVYSVDVDASGNVYTGGVRTAYP